MNIVALSNRLASKVPHWHELEKHPEKAVEGSRWVSLLYVLTGLLF